MDKNLKTIVIGVGGVVLLGLVAFVFFQFFGGNKQETPTQSVVTKLQDKTYLKYVALKGEEPTAEPTAEVTVTPTASLITPTTEETLSPSPTEIIVALSTPASGATDEAQTTTAPTTIAELPTTGLIQGSVVLFLIAASMIVFAFVL